MGGYKQRAKYSVGTGIILFCGSRGKWIILSSWLLAPSSIEETWRLWCKFLEDYSRFEDWLKMAEHSAANPNSAGVLYTVAKEELKKFEVRVVKTLIYKKKKRCTCLFICRYSELTTVVFLPFQGFQRQVHERLTQLELVNNQYRRLARENRTDRASQLKAMVREGNRRWDVLHRRVTAILRRLKVRQKNDIAASCSCFDNYSVEYKKMK